MANAFAALTEQEQSILILHCVLGMSDGKIGKIMELPRYAVQRRRWKALDELRNKLAALTPKGGCKYHFVKSFKSCHKKTPSLSLYSLISLGIAFCSLFAGTLKTS